MFYKRLFFSFQQQLIVEQYRFLKHFAGIPISISATLCMSMIDIRCHEHLHSYFSKAVSSIAEQLHFYKTPVLQTNSRYCFFYNEAISFTITIWLETKASAPATNAGISFFFFLVKQECFFQATSPLCIAKIASYMLYLFPKVMSPKHCHRSSLLFVKIEQ